jgi:protein TonB
LTGVRHGVAALLAMGVTFGLFYLMQALISMAEGKLNDAYSGQVVEFVRLKREEVLELKKREMPDKKPPEEPPPPPQLDLSRAARPDQTLGTMAIAGGLDLDVTGGPNLGAVASDSDVVPVVRVNPQYPIRAAERGIEGWVEVEFTISAAGTVKSPHVLNAHPANVFDRAALRAIAKWKYNPKIEDGVAVERPGVQVRLAFDLQE